MQSELSHAITQPLRLNLMNAPLDMIPYLFTLSQILKICDEYHQLILNVIHNLKTVLLRGIRQGFNHWNDNAKVNQEHLVLRSG